MGEDRSHPPALGQNREQNEGHDQRKPHGDERDPARPLDDLRDGAARAAQLHDRSDVRIEAGIDRDPVVEVAAIDHHPHALEDEGLVVHHVDNGAEVLRTVGNPRYGADRHERQTRQDEQRGQQNRAA